MLHLSTLSLIHATAWVPPGQHCDGLAKLCLLESKVGLQLVKSMEHLSVLQKEVRLQLRFFACCRIAKRELQTRFQKTVHGLCPS